MSPFPINQRNMKEVIDRQVASINDSRERAGIVCKDGKFSDLAIGGARYGNFSIGTNDVKSSCGKIPGTLIHMHGANLAAQSSFDRETHAKMFKAFPGMKAGCSVGIDGIECILANGKVKSKPFSKQLSGIIRGITGMESWKGDALFCDKAGSDHACSIRDGSHSIEKSIGTFSSVSVHGGGSWIGDPEADFESFAPPGKNMECHGVPGKKNALTCVTGKDRR